MARAKKAEAHTSGKNQREMVEEAMDAQGGNPGPKDIVSYLQEHYGVDMKYTMAASYKSNINKKRGISGGRGGAAVPAGSVDMRDVAAVKGLLDRLGVAQLTSIIRLLGR